MDILEERYALSCGRVREIAAMQDVALDYKDFFKKTAEFILLVADACDNRAKRTSLEELRAENKALYADIIGSNYEVSYANPTFACEKFGLDMGRLLSFLYTEMRAMIPCAFEKDYEGMVIRMELFVEIYNAFAYLESETELLTLPEETAVPSVDDIRDTMYWFVSDYSEAAYRDKVRCLVDTDCDFLIRIVMDSDLDDLTYLYRYGEYVSPEIEKMALYLNALPQERIQLMADTYTEGYRMGFVKAHVDLSTKETVDIRYMLGFERVVRAAIQNFERLGLNPTISRGRYNIFNKSKMGRNGCVGADANKQFLYDHKDDNALFMDKKLMNRNLEVLRFACEQEKEKAAVYAGPAVIEVFGETPFAPVAKSEACKLNPEQQKMSAELQGASQDILSR